MGLWVINAHFFFNIYAYSNIFMIKQLRKNIVFDDFAIMCLKIQDRQRDRQTHTHIYSSVRKISAKFLRQRSICL